MWRYNTLKTIRWQNKNTKICLLLYRNCLKFMLINVLFSCRVSTEHLMMPYTGWQPLVYPAQYQLWLSNVSRSKVSDSTGEHLGGDTTYWNWGILQFIQACAIPLDNDASVKALTLSFKPLVFRRYKIKRQYYFLPCLELVQIQCTCACLFLCGPCGTINAKLHGFRIGHRNLCLQQSR